MTGEALLKENNRIYAELVKVREKIKAYTSELDIEIALQGSNLYHHDDCNAEKAANLFCKLVILREREYCLQDLWRDNMREIRKIRAKSGVKHEQA